MKTASPGEERVTFEDREGGSSLPSLAGGRGCVACRADGIRMPNRKPSGEDGTQEAGERQPALGSQMSPNLRAAEAGRGGLLGNLERNERGPVTHRPVIVLTAAARGRLP